MLIFRRCWVFVIVIISCLFLLNGIAKAESKEDLWDSIDWVKGPQRVDLDDIATIYIPENHLFVPKKDINKFLDLIESLPSGLEVGEILGPEGEWYASIRFNPIGYVKDDEKDSLDADKILNSVIDSTNIANEERKKRGWGQVHVVGWYQKPRYNESTHYLEWAIKGKSDNEGYVINYNTRILGRKGVAEIVLVAQPSMLSSILPSYKNIVNTYNYEKAESYQSFVKGDKVAKYGLTALIVGGAAAAAVKTGLFKYIWKFLIFIAIGIAAGFKKIFGGKQQES